MVSFLFRGSCRKLCCIGDCAVNPYDIIEKYPPQHQTGPNFRKFFGQIPITREFGLYGFAGDYVHRHVLEMVNRSRSRMWLERPLWEQSAR